MVLVESGTGVAGASRRRAWGGLWVLAVALGMIVLDGTIVGVALPSIISGLRLDLTDAQWVNALYSVIFAALLLTMGRAGDRVGRRTVLLAGLALFVVGSVLAAASASASSLLLARAVQGVGGAMILPSTLSTVNATFRGRDRAAAFGVWGAVMSGAAAIGPLLGGWLTDVASWPWIFWVNVPVGLVLMPLVVWLVDDTKASDAGAAAGGPDASAAEAAPSRGLDLMGTALSAAGFGALVFGLIEGGSLGWWRPTAAFWVGPLLWPRTAPVSLAAVAILIGLAVLAIFVVWETAAGRRARPAILDLRLFAVPTFSLGNATAGLVAVGEFALLFALPLYLVSGLGLSMMTAGLVLAAMALGAFFSGAAARHLAARLGAPAVVVLGLALEVLGTLATAAVVSGRFAAWTLAATLLPYGIGLGLASAQLTSTTLRDVPADASGTGSATQSTVRQIGSALGSAMGGAVLTNLMGALGPTRRPSAADWAHAASWATCTAAGVLTLGLALAVALTRSARRPAQPLG